MKDFNRIIGNESIKEFFRSSISHQRVSHAYILEGEKGCGKKMIAAAFARMLQCESQEEKPCGQCTSCIQMEHDSHPDVIWMTHESANVIKVDEVREQLVNTIDVKPYRGPYKIYIIDEAEKLNEMAQNAILKTIEEPKEYAIIFLLTTNRGAFLPTILSRCILLGIKPVSSHLIKDYLVREESLDEGLAEFYAGFSMGNLGKAIAISSSEEFRQMRSHALDLLKSIHEAEINEIDQKVKECKEYKDRIKDYFDIVRMWFRDILILKTTKSQDKVIFKDSMITLSQQAKKLSLHDIDQIFMEIAQAERNIQSYVNLEASLDLLFFKVKELYAD